MAFGACWNCWIDVMYTDVNVIFCSIPKKSVCIAIGFKADRTIDSKMNIGDKEIQWVSELKYSGVHFKATRALDVNITTIMHKFYGAFN
jgi:hypothetical protein